MAMWRIKRGDKVAGEVPSSKIKQLAAAGKLKKTDLLCKEGTEKWIVAGNVKSFWQENSPSENKPDSAKAKDKPQAAPPLSPTDAESAARTDVVEKPSKPTPLQPGSVETPAQQEAIETPPQIETREPLPQEEDTEPLPQEEDIEPLPQQETLTSDYEATEEYADPDIQTHADPDDEYLEEPYDDQSEAPQRKWLVPLIAGSFGCILIFGLLSMMGGQEPEGSQQQSEAMRGKGPDTDHQPRSRSNSNLSLTQQFFQPNITSIVEYTTKKFVNNTTVADYRKTIIEKWKDNSTLYFHEKGFRKFGQTVPYRVSNGYVQLKAGEHWFRFLKLDAKVGDKWTPGDGEDGTADWTGSGEIELFDFKMVDSIPVAIVEFTAKPKLTVPSYLVPAAFDFGTMDESSPTNQDGGTNEDGGGTIEGKLRFELGQGLGMLRADAIVPKGTRHKDGGGRNKSNWIFATRSRNNADPAESPVADGQ